jgi:hypothetical protein
VLSKSGGQLNHSRGTPATPVDSMALHNKVLPVRWLNQIVYDDLGLMMTLII